MALPNEPITRQEMYLSNIAGQNTALPDAPITREEMYLDYIAKNGGGGTGEGDMKKSVYDSDDSIASAGGIKMFVNQKIGTLPQRVGSLETTAGVLEGEVASIEDTLDNLGTASTKNSTSVVTDSSDLVESGAVFDAIKGSVGFVTTGKNLLENTAINSSVSNVSFTVNADKSITVSGNNSTNIYAGIIVGEKSVSYGDVFVASCGSDALTSDTVRTQIDFYNGSTYLSNTFVLNDDTNITVPQNATKIVYRIYVAPNYTIPSPVTIYPMLRETGTSSSYEPYHASVEETIPQVVSDAVGWDVGNLIPMTITAMKAVNTLGTWNGNIYTLNGVTFEPNVLNNGVVDSIKINGTPSQWTQLYLSNAITLPVGNYALSSKNNIPNNVYLTYASFGQSSALSQNQNLKYVSITTPASNTPYVGLEGVTVTNLVVYPVIRNLNVNEAKCDNSVIGTVEGANASKAWSVGEHFIKDGAFKEVTQPIASGGAINSSNTVDRPIAELLNVESGTIIAVSDPRISLDSDKTKIYKQGNVVNFKVRFTLNENIVAANYITICFLPWTPKIVYPYFTVRDREAPYHTVSSCYIDTNSSNECYIVFNDILNAGIYDIDGCYICK